VAAELAAALHACERAAAGRLGFLSHGTHPTLEARLDPVVPNARFRVMERYFAPDSIHRWGNYTCALQVNLDVPPGVDWQEATVLGFVLSRFTHALFANSAYLHGQPVKGSARQALSGLVDPCRRAVPAEVVLADDLAAAYRDWALGVDVLFVGDVGLEELPRRGELPFRRWIEEGYRGTYPDARAWTRHLGTLWPDVRPRRFLELRAADAQPFEHVMAVVAFWRALIQLPGGSTDVRRLVGDFATVMARPADDPLFTDAGVQDALLALAAERLRATQEARWAEAIEAYRTRERSWSETAQAFVSRAATARPGVAFTG
jgi:glutamate--cysteine ligase